MYYPYLSARSPHLQVGFLGAGELIDTPIKQTQCICSMNNGLISSNSVYQLVSLHHNAISKTLDCNYSCLGSRPLHSSSSHGTLVSTSQDHALVFSQNLVSLNTPDPIASEINSSPLPSYTTNEAVKDWTSHLASASRKKKGGKKYKPVAVKVRLIVRELPGKFRIIRNIIGNPLKHLPTLSPHPPDFAPCGQYMAERKEIIDKHNHGFMSDIGGQLWVRTLCGLLNLSPFST